MFIVNSSCHGYSVLIMLRACCRGYRSFFLPSLLAVPVAASPSHDACSASSTCLPAPASGRTMVSRLSFSLSLSLYPWLAITQGFSPKPSLCCSVLRRTFSFLPSQAPQTCPTHLVSGLHGVRRVGMVAMPPISRNGSSQCYKWPKHHPRVLATLVASTVH